MHPSFSTAVVFLLALTSLCTARIISITAPTSVKAGKKFNVIFQTESNQVNLLDEFAIVGAFLGNATTCDSCIGTPLGYFNLHPDHESTGHGNFTESITISSPGSYVITAAVNTIVASHTAVTVRFFKTNIQVM
ncbi:hypothetical protein FRB94_006806 [Tulasnella sp. JGI-2019a]|nr:hypothetical protein FRB93_010380 [Tulasnella sp. JGI-2019a]KAG9012006.1 hypothetical protein FRB94_006806 [Tulasnella sp. JGI-2019a]KAG9030645.1 hypothetical protein FRB95_003660 [Tulasnella sp. JGI-2019a]